MHVVLKGAFSVYLYHSRVASFMVLLGLYWAKILKLPDYLSIVSRSQTMLYYNGYGNGRC